MVDTTPPEITVPADISVEAAGPGTAVSFDVSAQDAVDGAVTPVCSPESGSTFAVGNTDVICTATDASGNSAQASFLVSVVDTTPPVLTLPPDFAVTATSGDGAIVTYAASAADAVDGSVAVECLPPSGTFFAIGTTTVDCTAADRRGNVAEGSFTVTVTPGTTTVPFAFFSGFAQIDLRPGADDLFAVEAIVELGAGNNGIDPILEPFALMVGAAAWTIPPGSFEQTRFGAYVFTGTVGTTRLAVVIHRLHEGKFLVLAGGSGADLTGVTNPVLVSLAIGDDQGTIPVVAWIK